MNTKENKKDKSRLKKELNYTVTREYLGQYSTTDFVSRVIKSHQSK